MDVSLIEDLRKRKKLTQIVFAESIGFTDAGYTKMIKTGDLKISTLEKICQVYAVNISTFFKEYSNKSSLSIVAEESEVYGVTNFKQKYYDTLEELNDCRGRLLAFTDIKKGSTKK